MEVVEVTWDNLFWTIEGLVALGTIVLALVTFSLALVTYLTARSAKSEVDAVREQAALSRQALEASYRPLLVAVPLGLPELRKPETIRYPSGKEVTIADRGAVHLEVEDSGAIRCSVPFRNAGTGVALIQGNFLRPANEGDRGQLSGGPSMLIVAPGEIARVQLEAGDESFAETIRRSRAATCGVLYSDMNGEQYGHTRIHVSQGEDDRWLAGRTSLYHSGEDEPYAFGGW